MTHTLTDLPAQGTLLKLMIASTLTAIGQRVSLDGPEPDLPIRVVSNLDSTSVKKRTGLIDLGKISGKLFYDPNDATHGAARALVYAPPAAPSQWVLIYADGMTTPSQDAFDGFITKFKPTGMEVSGTLEAEFEIEITDSYAFTAGTA